MTEIGSIAIPETPLTATSAELRAWATSCEAAYQTASFALNRLIVALHDYAADHAGPYIDLVNHAGAEILSSLRPAVANYSTMATDFRHAASTIEGLEARAERYVDRRISVATGDVEPPMAERQWLDDELSAMIGGLGYVPVRRVLLGLKVERSASAQASQADTASSTWGISCTPDLRTSSMS